MQVLACICTESRSCVKKPSSLKTPFPAGSVEVLIHKEEQAMQANQRLKMEREVRGWSQAKVAEAVEADPASISRWERGISSPYPYFREKLCTLFGKNAYELGLLGETVDGEDQVYHPPMSPSDPAIPLPLSGMKGVVGRDDLLQRLKEGLLTDGGAELTALSGLPGVGKTILAVQAVYDRDILAHFRDGVLWAGLGPQPNVLDLLSHWGKMLNMSPSEMKALRGRRAWSMALREAIGERRMLVVIDDAWQAEEALAFQVGGPHCRYLLTTRFPHLAAQVAATGTLVVPELSDDDGVELLKHFAPQVVTGDPTMAQTLVRSVGGLPLALTLMGRYLRVQAHSGQPRRLQHAVEWLHDAEHRLRLSTPSPAVDRPAHLPLETPVSLQSVIAVSDQQLDEQAREALRALSILPTKPNSFSEDAALAVSQVPVETLDVLCDAGLLESGAPGRYAIHQTISDYARTYLSDSGSYERLIAYCLSQLQEHSIDYDILEQDIVTILAALEAAYALRRQAELVQGVLIIAPFLCLRGQYSWAEMHLQRAHQVAVAQENVPALVSLLLYQGEVAQMQGDYTQAEAFLQEGLLLARDLGDSEPVSALLAQLGAVAVEQGNYIRAEAYLREGLTLAQQLNQHERIGTLLRNLGWVTTEKGDFLQAEAYLQEGLIIARQLDHPELVCRLLTGLAALAFKRGNYASAKGNAREGLVLARRLGHRERMTVLLGVLGEVAVEQGKYVRARGYLHEGLILARQINHLELISFLLQVQGKLAVERGKYVQARAYLQEGLVLARQINHHERTSALLGTFGVQAGKQGDYLQADAYFQEGLSLARQIGHPWMIAMILKDWGEIHLAHRHLDAAAAAFEEVLTLNADALESQDLLAHAQYGIARVTAAQGTIAQACSLAEESLAIFNAISDCEATTVRRWLNTLTSSR